MAEFHLLHKRKKEVSAVSLDGHEKIATRCEGEPPARGGRPKGNGHVKYFNNGWFMICSPENQLILSVVEMFEPEGHQVALESLTKLLQHYPNINAVIYDRACSVVAAARKDKALSGIKHWSVDKFHAKGHVHECPGHPERLPALKRRLKGLNTSISEQTFLGSAGTPAHSTTWHRIHKDSLFWSTLAVTTSWCASRTLAT